MDTITPLSPIFPVGSATRQNRGQGQGHQTLSQGQLFKALVLENRGNNRFILDIGGNRLTARSEAALSPGQSLRLEVVTTSPEIQLKIIADTRHQLTGRSLVLLGKNLDISTLIQALQQQSPPLLQRLTPASRNILERYFSLQQGDLGTKGGGIMLQRLIQDSGLNLEQLLAAGRKDSASRTLKSALLEVAHQFKSTESITETTSRILSTLELFQIAQVQAGNDTQFILPLPLPYVEQGFLVVEREAEESAGSAETSRRFSLHLTMTELGNLRIDFLQSSEGLFLRFYADSQEKADFIANFSEELKSTLTSVELTGIIFTADAEDPINELVRKITGKSGTLLDTKV